MQQSAYSTVHTESSMAPPGALDSQMSHHTGLLQTSPALPVASNGISASLEQLSSSKTQPQSSPSLLPFLEGDEFDRAFNELLASSSEALSDSKVAGSIVQQSPAFWEQASASSYVGPLLQGQTILSQHGVLPPASTAVSGASERSGPPVGPGGTFVAGGSS